jgi:peptidoglycan biosynthesis protein MviN/MurJ (putative lipid II flippase)
VREYTRFRRYFVPDLAKLEKRRGKLGMTWRQKVQGVTFAVLVLSALAMSAGAGWMDGLASWLLGW